MNKNSVKKFVKDHKIELICGGLGAIAGTALAIKIGKNVRSNKTYDAPESLVRYGIAKVVEDSESIQLMIDTDLSTNAYAIPIEDLGKFGEALCDIPGVAKANLAWIMIDIVK